jgi:O-antigen ligase
MSLQEEQLVLLALLLRLVLLALLLRLVSLALLLRLVSLALVLRLVLLALVLLPSVLLVPPRPSLSALWRRLEDVRLPHQSTAEGRDMLTAMMTRAVCQRQTLWG